MVLLDLLSDLLYKDGEFSVHPLQGVVGHVVDKLMDRNDYGMVVLMVKIMRIVKTCFFKQMSIFPVECRITMRTEHLKTPRFLFNGDMTTRALFGRLCDHFQRFDLVLGTRVWGAVLLVASHTYLDPTGGTGM